jgi:thiamine pyrophosphokinase
MKIAIVCAGPCHRAFLHEFRKNKKPDYFIAADRGLLTCLYAGIIPDCVLGDYDSLFPNSADLEISEEESFPYSERAEEGSSTDPERAEEESSAVSERAYKKFSALFRKIEYHEDLLEKLSREGKRVLTYPARKDFSDSEAAVREAVRIIMDARQKADSIQETTDVSDEIYLLGATGGRLDHFLANLAVLMIPTKLGIRAWILDEKNRITLLREGCSLEKKHTFGKYVSLIPYTDEVTGVVLKGFRYLLNGHTFTRDNTLGLSNEIEDEIAEISFESGILIMILSMD